MGAPISLITLGKYNEKKEYTETDKKACTWLREFCSCSCLTALPGLAWVLHSKIYITFLFPSVYIYSSKIW